MSTSTTYIDRLERELLGAIGRRRRKRTVVTRLAAIAALASAVVATLVVGLAARCKGGLPGSRHRPCGSFQQRRLAGRERYEFLFAADDGAPRTRHQPV